MFYRILLFFLSGYTIYLYTREFLLESGMELPIINALERFDIAVVHFGGVVSGMLLLFTRRKFDKWWGIGMIVLNFAVLSYLYMQAIN